MLRRPKSTISLPLRRDFQRPLDFSDEERKAYNRVRGQAITKIDEALHSGSDPSRNVAYVNVLQQIESLRLICNLGLYYHSRHEETSHKLRENWDSMAQTAFNSQREIKTMACLHCSADVGLAESLLDGKHEAGGQFFRCLRFRCGDCSGKNRRSHAVGPGCGHRPACPAATVSLVGQAIENPPSLVTLREPEAGMELPSKIRALVEDIKSLPSDTKW